MCRHILGEVLASSDSLFFCHWRGMLRAVCNMLLIQTSPVQVGC